MPKAFRVLIALVSFLVLAASTPQSQKSAPAIPSLPSMGETLDVSIVNVDAYVTDRQGNRVRGLTEADFEIFDGGVKQPISNFSEYSSGDVTATVPAPDRAPSAEAAAAPPQKRTIVLFVERMVLPNFEADPFIAGIRKTFHSLVRPGDDAALILWARGKAIRYDGLEDIDKALDGIAREFVGQNIDPTRIAQELAEEARLFESELESFAASRGISLPDALRNSNGDTAAEIMKMRLWADMQPRIAAIDAAISSMAASEGKKILLLAPRSLGDVVLPSLKNEPQDQFERMKYGTEVLMRPVLRNANASGVTIYTLFAARFREYMPDASLGGGGAGIDSIIEQVQDNALRAPLGNLNERFSLQKIASATGGLFAASVTEIVKLLPRVEEDVTDYYSLAFRGDASKGDRVRNIVVKTKNPDFRVRTRRQFVEKSDVSRMKDRVAAALTFRPAGSFDISGKVGKVAKARGQQTVPLSIRIPVGALTAISTGDHSAGAFSVYVASGTGEGRLSEVAQKTQSYELADAGAASAGYFTYSVDVVIDNKTDRIAVGVFDEVSKEYALLRLPLKDSTVP